VCGACGQRRQSADDAVATAAPGLSTRRTAEARARIELPVDFVDNECNGLADDVGGIPSPAFPCLKRKV
jgi:hypothetical protein